MWIKGLPFIASLAFLIWAAPFGQAAEHTVSADFDQIRWAKLLARLNPGDGLTFESPTPYRVTLGAFVGSGNFGEVYRLAGDSNRIIKLAQIYQPPHSAPVADNIVFLEEATALRTLDSTSIRHPRIITTIGSIAFIKEYIEGSTLTHYLETWQTLSLDTNLTVINQLVKLGREIQAQNIYFSDLHPGNIVLQARTFIPYVIDLGHVTIRNDAALGPEPYHIQAFVNCALDDPFVIKAVWLGVVQPVLLRSFLRIEELARELRQNPTQATLDSLTREVHRFDRVELPVTEDGQISREVRTKHVDVAKKAVFDMISRTLHRAQSLDATQLRASLCSASLTNAN